MGVRGAAHQWLTMLFPKIDTPMKILKNGGLGFDTEITGVDPFNDRIVSASVVHILNDFSIARQKSWLINPGVAIPPGASDVHGISNEKVKEEGVAPLGALSEIRNWLLSAAKHRIPVCVFNAAFDCTILRHELARYDLPDFSCDDLVILDPLVLDRHLDRYRKGSRLLAAVTAHYDCELSEEEAHNAYFDAVAAVHIVRALSEKFPVPADHDGPALMNSQALWHEVQAASLEEYMRRSDPQSSCSRGWPFYAIVN